MTFDDLGTMAPHPAYQRLLDEGIFALPTCTACVRAHFSPRVLCPHCGSTALRWQEASGFGVVYSASAVARREQESPVVLLVDLDEGPRLMSNLVGPPPTPLGDLIGARVRTEIGVRDGHAVPLFRVVES